MTQLHINPYSLPFVSTHVILLMISAMVWRAQFMQFFGMQGQVKKTQFQS